MPNESIIVEPSPELNPSLAWCVVQASAGCSALWTVRSVYRRIVDYGHSVTQELMVGIHLSRGDSVGAAAAVAVVDEERSPAVVLLIPTKPVQSRAALPKPVSQSHPPWTCICRDHRKFVGPRDRRYALLGSIATFAQFCPDS